MLDSSKIKEFILHPDVHLSNAAIEYFNDSFSEDREVLNLALDRYPSLNDAERKHLLMHTENLNVDMEAVKKILQYLPDASHKLKLQLEKLLCNAEISLLKQVDLTKLKLYPDFKNIIDNKLKFSLIATEDLLDELFDFSVQNALRYMNEFDYGYGNLIVKELAARDDLGETIIVEQLTEIDIEEFTYYECYLLTLCGMRKLASLIPVFVHGLSSDDLVSEESMFALTRIGTKEVVDIIENRYPEEEDDFKIFAGGTLENIKSPESERAAIKLLKQETDITLKTLMAGALCRLNSSEAIPEISKLIEEGYDSSMLNLEEYAYVNCSFNGLDIPEMAAWKKSYEEERAFYLNSSKPSSSDIKIGRNDPCPCGSGLKYKKCCGANK